MDETSDTQESAPSEDATAGKPRRRRRILRRAAVALAALVVLVGALVGGGVLWLRTPWGHAFVRDQIAQRLSGAMEGEARVGSVEGDILTGITLHDFALVAADGVPFVQAETVRATYDLRPLTDKRIVVGRVRLERPRVTLVRHADGRWNFQTLFPRRVPEKPPEPGPGWGSFIDVGPVEIVDGVVDVRLAAGEWPVLDWHENRFVDVDGTVRLGLFSRERNLKRFEVEDLSFRATAPPLTVTRLAGTGVVTPDSIALRRIDLVTAASSVEADGRLLLGERDSFELAVDGEVGLDEVRRLFPAVVRLDGRAWFEGRLTGPAADLTIAIESARVETAGSVANLEGRITRLADPRFDLTARVAPLAPADARAYVAEYPVDQPVTGSVRLDGPLGQLGFDADLRAPAGAFAVRGTIDRGAALGYDLVATSRDLDVGALIGRPSVDLVLTGRYELDGRGTGPRELDARFAATLGASRIWGREVVEGATRGRLEGRTYVADTVWMRTPASLVRGEGRFDLAGDGGMDAEVVLDSDDLGEIAPQLEDAAGRTHATGRLAGPYRGFDVTAEVAAADLSVAAVTADSFAGDLRIDDVGTGLRLAADGTFRDLAVAGVRADTAAVELDLAGDSLRVDGTFEHPGDARTILAGAGDLSGPSPTFTLERFAYEGPEGRWTMAEGSRLSYADGQVVARDFRITENGQTLRAEGVLGIEGPSDLDFAAENVELKTVARLMGQPPGDWQGRATVEGSLAGPREDPVIDVRGRVSEGMIRGFRFQRVEGSIDYANETARVDLTVTTPTEGRALVLRGEAPVDLALVGGVDRLPERPVDLEIRGENMDLSIVGAVIPGLTDVSGPIDLRVRVRGTSEDPRFEGSLVIRDGRLTIPATGVTYEAIHGRIEFDNDRIRVSELRGSDGDTEEGDGVFTLTGSIDVQNLQLGEFDLALEASGLRILDQDRRTVQVDATIDLTGTTDRPVLTGRVVVDEAIYRLPERSRKNVIDLEEAVVYVEIPGTRTAEETPVERSPGLWERARVNLDIVVTDDAILQNDNARIEIAGDLTLFKAAGAETPSLSGTLDVRRGFYEEFGQRFTIEGGSVFFYGTPDINPGLHVVATRTVEGVQGVGDVNIRITLGGTLENPTIDLSSTPPFDKSEIISLALFGTPHPSASQQGRFTETARDLVLDQGTAALSSQLAQELNLDTLEVLQRGGIGGETAQLFRVGKFITPDVYLSFEQEVGGGPDGDQEQAVGLRYQVSDQFMLEATAGTLQSGIDFFWEFTY